MEEEAEAANTSTFEIEDPVDRRDEIIDDSTVLEAKILSGFSHHNSTRSSTGEEAISADRNENEHQKG